MCMFHQDRACIHSDNECWRCNGLSCIDKCHPHTRRVCLVDKDARRDTHRVSWHNCHPSSVHETMDRVVQEQCCGCLCGRTGGTAMDQIGCHWGLLSCMQWQLYRQKERRMDKCHRGNTFHHEPPSHSESKEGRDECGHKWVRISISIFVYNSPWV